MKTWIITDTHFGHHKLTEIGERPEGFESIIFKNLKQISPEDLVIHLWDFCIWMDASWHLAWNEALPTQKKILIKGNHDCKSNSWYYDHWWSFVCDGFTDMFLGKQILFSHEPADMTLMHVLNIHGHTHGNAHRDTEHCSFYWENNIDVALELNGYIPLTINSLLWKHSM